MKKFIVILLTLAMASVVNATVVEVVPTGVGDAGHAGTVGDPLDVGETIGFQIVLNDNDHFGTPYDAYDGYFLSGIAFDLDVSTGGTLAEKAGGMFPGIKTHSFIISLPDPLIVENGIHQIVGLGTGDGVQSGTTQPGVGPKPLVWNLTVTATGSAPTIDIGIQLVTGVGTMQYSDYGVSMGSSWQTLLDSHLSGDTLHVIPEPATVIILGLGGLALLRRRRRA